MEGGREGGKVGKLLYVSSLKKEKEHCVPPFPIYYQTTSLFPALPPTCCVIPSSLCVKPHEPQCRVQLSWTLPPLPPSLSPSLPAASSPPRFAQTPRSHSAEYSYLKDNHLPSLPPSLSPSPSTLPAASSPPRFAQTPRSHSDGCSYLEGNHPWRCDPPRPRIHFQTHGRRRCWRLGKEGRREGGKEGKVSYRERYVTAISNEEEGDGKKKERKEGGMEGGREHTYHSPCRRRKKVLLAAICRIETG